MPSLFHRNPAQANDANLEKPQPAHAHEPRSSVGTQGTAVNSPHMGTHHGAAGGPGGAPIGDVSTGGNGSGKAWIYQRPTFGEWVKMYWVDLLTMAALGAVGLGIYEADPAPTREFPVQFSDGEIVYPQFAYALRHNIIPIYAAALIAFFVPFIVFCICQIRVKSFDDLNTATFGVLYSLINAAVFQVFIKYETWLAHAWLIGGLRPHFLSVCKPVIDTSTIGSGFQNIMYDRSICTGDRAEINDSLESMPSGHSTAAWAGLLFLSLYLNAKLKLFSDYRPQFWKMIAFFAPLLGAFLISASLTIDEYHNWYDCVAGGIIGSCSAIAAYRMSYASIWDFRFNHLPLPRTPPMAGHSTWAYSAPRFPYDTSLIQGPMAGGLSPWAGQWRGESFTGVQGAPGDAVKGGAGAGAAGTGTGGHHGGYPGHGSAGIV
ncbi:hypothetical protein JCM11641_003681 [Rhodosporidiobolus odoratus]